MECFSIFNNTYDVVSRGELTMHELYEVIALRKKLSDCQVEPQKWMDHWPFKVQDFRLTKNKYIKERNIPAVIFFAVTAATDRKQIKERSGYFGIDLDYGDNRSFFDKVPLAAVKQLVAERFPSAALMFISPSGKGLKVAHKIEPVGPTLEDHHHVSRKVFQHFQQAYREIGISIDYQCKDWNRLCYLSYDREAYYNADGVPENVAIPSIVVQPVPVIEDGENGYQLSGDRRDKDQVCPQCRGGQHRDKSFTYYVDQYGTRLEGCGVCSRSKCNANIKPWEEYPNVMWKYLGKTRS